MDNGKSYRGITMGLASMVVIFVVISLTIFAALSVSTAAQEKRLAEKYAGAVSAYWAADAECAQLANAFGAAWAGPDGEAAVEKLAAASGAELTREGGDLLVAYDRPVSDVSALEVTLRLGARFRIEKWRTVSTDENWAPDDTLPVWQG